MNKKDKMIVFASDSSFSLLFVLQLTSLNFRLLLSCDRLIKQIFTKLQIFDDHFARKRIVSGAF